MLLSILTKLRKPTIIMAQRISSVQLPGQTKARLRLPSSRDVYNELQFLRLAERLLVPRIGQDKVGRERVQCSKL